MRTRTGVPAPGRMLPGVLLGVLLGLPGMLLAGCSAPADPALVASLEDLDTPLYLPDLRGSSYSGLEVGQGAARADVEDQVGATLLEQPYADDGRALCVALRAVYLDDSDCSEEGDTMVADFEEMTTVAVVRDGTVLVLGGLVTEADGDLRDDAVTALREAPEVDADELARAAGT